MPGSITKRGKNSYRIRLDAPPDASGSRRQVSETVHGTKKDAERRLAELVVEIGDGKCVARKDVTVAEAVEVWLKKYKYGHADSTYCTAEGLLRLHVVEGLGKMPVSGLTPSHVDSVMIRMLDDGLRPRTVRYLHWLLKSVLDGCLNRNEISHNSAAKVKPPRDLPKEVPALTDTQVQAFLQEVGTSRLGNAFIVAIGTGVRRGELLGLKWADVDFRAGVINIKRSYSRSGGQGKFTDGKTANSRRQIPMSETVRMALCDQKARQDAERTNAKSEWQENDLVFATKQGTPVHPDSFCKQYLKPILERAGLTGVHMHQFRHTFAAWCITKGVDVKKVSVFLGHYDVAFTYRKYHHVVPHASVKEDSFDIEAAMFRVSRDQVVTNTALVGPIARDSKSERPATSTVAAQ